MACNRQDDDKLAACTRGQNWTGLKTVKQATFQGPAELFRLSSKGLGRKEARVELAMSKCDAIGESDGEKFGAKWPCGKKSTEKPRGDSALAALVSRLACLVTKSNILALVLELLAIYRCGGMTFQNPARGVGCDFVFFRLKFAFFRHHSNLHEEKPGSDLEPCAFVRRHKGRRTM